ncbi:hypothetical protein XELAEV_18038472mg [Xenopus laevis]|uniref:Uncharacterized protein n=1 Tax=Xenopus laevis TaxID=8355 RepID=A0A974H7C7_XENLA|nr:hypothetical protein XELAEV_18038472mg [Xenopus laevis]
MSAVNLPLLPVLGNLSSIQVLKRNCYKFVRGRGSVGCVQQRLQLCRWGGSRCLGPGVLWIMDLSIIWIFIP